MDNYVFHGWAKNVRETLYHNIQMNIYRTGEYPEAIIAGGEYAYAIMDDYKDIQHTVNGGYLWRGISFFRCSGLNGVKLVYKMCDVDLPPVEE